MATLTRRKCRGDDGKPTWRIRFYDGAGRQYSVYVGAVPKKAADVWLSRIEQPNACRIAGVAPDRDLAAWVGSLPPGSYDKLVQVGLIEQRENIERESIDVAQLTAAFVERSSAKPATVQGFQQTLDSLVAFFSTDTTIKCVTMERADD